MKTHQTDNLLKIEIAKSWFTLFTLQKSQEINNQCIIKNKR